MLITINDKEPIDKYPYLEVGAGQLDSNGNPKIYHRELPIYFGEYLNKNTKVDYLIICSDLQGISEELGKQRLLGETLPEYLKLLLEVEYDISEKTKIGVLLTGDFYTNLEKRGSSGDVRNVWKAFNEQFDWVIGVAGNHDRFGDNDEKNEFKNKEGIFLLHKNIEEVDGLKIGGISGIIGRGDKTNRVGEKEYLDTLKKFLNQDLDFVLLHETPDFPKLDFIGNSKIRKVVEKVSPSKIICGHCFWERTMIKFENQSTILNVDSKVVILKIIK